MRYQEETSARRLPHFTLLLLTAILMVSSSTGATADTIEAVGNPLDALANTAAIVEGTVKENSYTFDEKAGPRTVATLVDVQADFGRFADTIVPLATLGGPISEKQGLFIPELPLPTDDTRYLVFLTNVDWFFSPVVESYVFRLEPDANGNEKLIAPSGYAVVGVSADGLLFSSDPVVDTTQTDLDKPTARRPLLDGAPAVLASAMSKERFLAAVGNLLKTVPLQGAFNSSPSRDRIWNRIPTGDKSLRNANGR
ncbi:MAG TPA: hypothetical protein VGS07_13465 [Thermoanaerobaculia bacterium]|jgi:hypothetical protein|nr:hypothetical protein [Thermoanaerobaculia bacterium]